MSSVRSIAFRLTVVALLGLLSPPMSGDEEPSAPPSRLDLTLDEAIRLALKNNRSLLNARLMRTLDKFALEVTGDRYLPQASIGPTVRRARGEDATADASVEAGLRLQTGGQFTLSWSEPLAGNDDAEGTLILKFSQPLLRGFGSGVETAPLRSAGLEDRIGVLVFRETIAGVVDTTIQAWRGLVRANRQLRIGEASLERAREQLETNRTLIEAGRMAARDILQSETDVAQRELDLVQLRNGMTAANFVLVDVLDIDSATAIRPVGNPTLPRQIISVEQAKETALRHSTDFAQAQLRRAITEIDLEVAESNLRWDLRLEAGASRSTGDGGSGVDYSVGMRMAIPLGDRSPKLELMRARASLTRAVRRLHESRQAVDIRVRQALQDVEVGERRIELARRALDLSERKLENERRKLQQGLSSIFQLSRIEDDLIRAQNAELDALVNYENSLTALDRILGTTLETWDIRVEQVGR